MKDDNISSLGCAEFIDKFIDQNSFSGLESIFHAGAIDNTSLNSYS